MSSVLFLENIEDVVLHLRLWEEFFVCLKTARMRLKYYKVLTKYYVSSNY